MKVRKHRKKYPFAQSVRINITDDDFRKLKEGLANSTCRTMSEYGRKLILQQPVTVFYRSQSFDAFIDEAIALRKQMEIIRQSQSFTKEGEAGFLQLQEEIKIIINKIFDYVSQNSL